MHSSKGFWEIVNKAKESGCIITEKSGTIKVVPLNKSLPIYTCHAGERGLHPLRRYLKNTCKLAV
jgi:hypothetical protein